MLKSFSIILILLFLGLTVFAQDKEITVNGYRGLEIDKSSPDDVIKLLGKPKKVKEKERFLYNRQIEKWFNHNPEDKKFKKLVYGEVFPFNSIDLYFLDNKLVGINGGFMDPSFKYTHVLFPDDLEGYFGVQFKSYISRSRKHFPVSVKEFLEYSPPPNDGKDSKGIYYTMTAITEKTFLVASINSAHGFDGKPLYREHITTYGKPRFHGFVLYLQIISRTLEKK